MNPLINQKLESFEMQGQNILSQYSTRMAEIGQTQKNRGIARGALNFPIMGPKYRKAGKFLLNITEDPLRKKRIEAEFANLATSWLASITDYLNGISRATKSLSKQGNSQSIIRMFTKAKTGVKPETKLNRGLGAITRLKTIDLILNTDISNYLREKKATGMEKHHFWAKEINKLLAKHPAERMALLGAIESFEAKRMDANRQCLSSCRNCIESLVKKLSSNARWSEGLPHIVASKQKRRIIKDTYAFLSIHGTHGSESPSDADTRAGVDQTLASVRLIITSK